MYIHVCNVATHEFLTLKVTPDFRKVCPEFPIYFNGKLQHYNVIGLEIVDNLPMSCLVYSVKVLNFAGDFFRDSQMSTILCEDLFSRIKTFLFIKVLGLSIFARDLFARI